MKNKYIYIVLLFCFFCVSCFNCSKYREETVILITFTNGEEKQINFVKEGNEVDGFFKLYNSCLLYQRGDFQASAETVCCGVREYEILIRKRNEL